MFEWLERWAENRRRESAKRIVEPFLKGTSLATAFMEGAAEYTQGVREGRISHPAHKRKLEDDRGSVVARWGDIRLETIANAHAFGSGSLFEVATVSQQVKLLDALATRSLDVAFAESGDVVEDSISCLELAYEYLGKIGQELCDDLCDVVLLRSAGKTIHDDLIGGATALREQWRRYRGNDSPPRTLFELFVDDLNRKTKSLALSSVFGPEYEKTFRSFVEKESASATAGVVQTFQIVLRAPNPDAAIKELDRAGL